MKLYIYFLVLFSSFTFSQTEKEKNIEEVIIKSKPKVATILKKLNKQLLKQTDTTSYVFNLKQLNLKNNDTLIHRNEEQIIKIINFNNNFTKKNVIENKDNWFSNFKEIFAAYSAEESPIGWLSGFPIRKNLTTVELDFFTNSTGYVYTREWLDNGELLVTFESKNFYKGNFIVDKHYNLVQLNYETIEPYPFFYTSAENVGKFHKFTQNWTYYKEKVAMSFEIVNKKMVLKQLHIEEKLRDFLFHRFDKDGVTFTDKNHFYTNIKLQNQKYPEEE